MKSQQCPAVATERDKRGGQTENGNDQMSLFNISDGTADKRPQMLVFALSDVAVF